MVQGLGGTLKGFGFDIPLGVIKRALHMVPPLKGSEVWALGLCRVNKGYLKNISGVYRGYLRGPDHVTTLRILGVGPLKIGWKGRHLGKTLADWGQLGSLRARLSHTWVRVAT